MGEEEARQQGCKGQVGEGNGPARLQGKYRGRPQSIGQARTWPSALLPSHSYIPAETLLAMVAKAMRRAGMKKAAMKKAMKKKRVSKVAKGKKSAWIAAVAKARSALKIKGFCPCGGKTAQGKALLA